MDTMTLLRALTRATAGQAPVLALGVALLAALPAHAQDLPSGPISLGGGRVTLGADLSASTTPQDDTNAWFNYTDYEHNTLRMIRIAVSADVRLSDRISFLTEVRSENGASIKPYALYVRVHPWKNRPVDIQAGRIPPTFGAFSRRDYGAGNALIGYPLAYQYLTSLRADAIPADADDLLRMRARGWRPSYRIGAQSIGPGLPLITAFRWDTGVQARIGSERLMVSAALTNGTVSEPLTRDNNGGKQISGLRLGGSAAHGPFVSDAVGVAADGRPSAQDALGVDVEYARDHWLVRSELVWDRWQVPTLDTPLRAASVFVEGSYKILPGTFVAGRFDRLTFSRVSTPTQDRTWDAPVTRIETGLGYYIRRNLIAKGTYQYNWRDGGLIRRRGLLAAQLHYWL
jgi:hypothetical protein